MALYYSFFCSHKRISDFIRVQIHYTVRKMLGCFCSADLLPSQTRPSAITFAANVKRETPKIFLSCVNSLAVVVIRKNGVLTAVCGSRHEVTRVTGYRLITWGTFFFVLFNNRILHGNGGQLTNDRPSARRVFQRKKVKEFISDQRLNESADYSWANFLSVTQVIWKAGCCVGKSSAS